MWNRAEVKEKGKANFKKNYWKSVVVAFIYTLFFTSTAAVTSQNSEELTNSINEKGYDQTQLFAFFMVFFAVLGIVMLVITLVDIFLLNPLEVGCSRFFLVNQDQNAEFGELSHNFSHNYLGTVCAIFLRNLIIAVGYALFIVPGCILTYSYRMVPYILAENPGTSAIEALKKSREMMKGQKWNCFVYDLSFILWGILSACTLGLVGLFYVNPYKLNADAALYQKISAGK